MPPTGTSPLMPPSYLTDAQWTAVLDNLPRRLGIRARNRSADYRRFVDSIIWVSVDDRPWTNVSANQFRARQIYARFLRWRNAGAWNAVADAIGADSDLSSALKRRVRLHIEHSSKLRNRKADLVLRYRAQSSPEEAFPTTSWANASPRQSM